MADPESLRRIAYSPTPFSTWLGIVCLFVLFGLIVLAVIGPSLRGNDYEQARAQKRIERLKTLREETEKELTNYAWADKSKGVARIPIERAMQLTVAELAQKKPVPAGPIAAPEPQGPAASAAPAPAGSPQPAASPSGPAPPSPSPAAQSPSAASAPPSPAKTP